MPRISLDFDVHDKFELIKDVEIATKQLKDERGIPHEQVRKRLKKWGKAFAESEDVLGRLADEALLANKQRKAKTLDTNRL